MIRRRVACLLFDLDGTLYSAENGYIQHIRENLFNLIVDKGFAENREAAYKLWQPLFKQYNQSFRGLKAGGYELDADEYWASHRGGMEKFFQPDVSLRELLLQMPFPKHIFTNCREKEAEEALHHLGVRDCFNKLYGADFMGDVCKPEPACFEAVLRDLKVDAADTVFFEDSLKNLRTAKDRFGMRTVLVDSMTAREEGVVDLNASSQLHYVDAVVTTLSDGGAQLRKVMPDIFID